MTAFKKAISQNIFVHNFHWLPSITPCQTNVIDFGAEKLELCLQKIFKAFFGAQQIANCYLRMAFLSSACKYVGDIEPRPLEQQCKTYRSTIKWRGSQ
jgi:hypothetical protein